MTQEEYMSKTKEATNFLMKFFSDDVRCTATIVTMQADQNTDKLISILELIKHRCIGLINELKEIEK